MNKKVSVIMPFYNGKEWLEEALDSVLAQTYTNMEVLLVNDGSLEDITDIVRKYKGKIRYFEKENGGVSTARNLGMKEAKGDYIAFMDSDDYWMPEKTAKQVAFMEERNIVWSHTGFVYWYYEEGREVRVHNNKNYGEVHEAVKIHFQVSTPSVMISRTILDDHTDFIFPVEFRTGQDSAFYRMLSKYYQLGFIEEPLMKVRIRGDNSGRRAMVRLHMSSQLNERRIVGSDGFDVEDFFVRTMIRYNAWGYKMISKLKFSDTIKEKLAKAYWAPAFIFERVYSKKYQSKTEIEEKYILRYDS
ncbi:glycosyltransferase family 2 protein [Bacteroides sp. GM023]|uniref:glycosyltransferase family 2 protein n=1 Tax=Bacteroides sp. GM023 TaxID=2723058 RepID=UPI0021042A02|nr:glycosyltransferase family 2 protein [Bacteroides sp. GM023]